MDAEMSSNGETNTGRPTIDLVRDFMTMANQPIGVPITEQRELRLSMLNEEIGELGEALAADDRVEIADALADIVYVAVGAAVTWGVDIDILPAPRGCTRQFSHYAHINYHNGRLAEQLDYASGPDDILELDCVIHYCYRMASSYDIPLDAVIAEVHRSNMAKQGGPVDESGKLGKPEGWTPPDVRGVLERAGAL